MLVGHGFEEPLVLDMPMDKFDLYARAVRRSQLTVRYEAYGNTLQAIGSAFSKDGLKKVTANFKRDMEQDREQIL